MIVMLSRADYPYLLDFNKNFLLMSLLNNLINMYWSSVMVLGARIYVDKKDAFFAFILE